MEPTCNASQPAGSETGAPLPTGKISGCRAAIPLYLASNKTMTRQQILDLYFLDARHKLIELAAFLDRAERSNGKDDFRLKAFRTALKELSSGKKQKAKRVQLVFSDKTTKPVVKAKGVGANGAWLNNNKK